MQHLHFLSPFVNSDILTIDGHGEDSCFLGFGKNDKIIKTENTSVFCRFICTFTDFLGFKPDSDEWKVMALALMGKTS